MNDTPHADATLLAIVQRDLWHLDHDLVAAHERRLIADVAGWFPAPFAARYGLELDLPQPNAGSRATVDLSLGVDRRDPTATILAGTDDPPLPEPLSSDGTWRGLRAFAAAWTAAADGPFATIPQIWLAFPQPDRPGRIPAPAISIGLEPGATAADALAVFDTVGLLAPDVARAQRDPFARVLAAIGRAPAYLAVHPARSATALRIELEVQPAEIPVILAAVGWPGDTGRLAPLVDWAARGDIVRLAFDLDRAVAPRIGIALSASGHWATRIRRQLGMLYGLADLGAVSRRIAERIASGVRREVEAADVGDRVLVQHGLSHIKATLEADGSMRAKAYAGTLRHPLPPAATATSAADAVADARRRAVAYLLGAQDASGAWHGLVDLGGCATTRVTANAAHALAVEGGPRALAAARRGWAFLQTQRQSTGWSSGKGFDPDAGATTWTLRVADALGLLDRPEHTGLVDLLAFFATADGAGLGLDTRIFGDDVAIPPQPTGDDQPHLCITAAAASLPGVSPRFLDTLRQAQLANGSWFSPSWPDHEYATAHAIEALVASDDAADAERIAWAGAWLRGRMGEKGAARSTITGAPSPFATALAAYALALLGDPAAPRARAWLVDAQLPDGSWAASDWTQRPERNPAALEPHAGPAGPAPIVDGSGILTTATVVRALAIAR